MEFPSNTNSSSIIKQRKTCATTEEDIVEGRRACFSFQNVYDLRLALPKRR